MLQGGGGATGIRWDPVHPPPHKSAMDDIHNYVGEKSPVQLSRDPHLGQAFLNTTPKALTIKEKNNNLIK